MNIRYSSLMLTCIALAVTKVYAAPNTLTSDEISAGWKLLFNGESLAGWRGYATETPTGWRVQDGAIVASKGRKGDLVTVHQFDDFELSLEWKISEGGNSGIIYRAGLGDAAAARSGPEYQLLDNAKAKDNKIASHLAGSLYDLVAPPHDATRTVGEWNESRVRVRGWKVEHWLNGVRTAEIDLASPAGRALIQGSKFKDWPRFASFSQGHIALQDHGDVVHFRSVKIRAIR